MLFRSIIIALLSFICANTLFAQDGIEDNKFNFRQYHRFLSGDIRKIQIQSDERIILGGNFIDTEGNIQNLCRILPNKERDTTFHPSLNIDGIVNDMILLPNGQIIVVGDFEVYDGDSVGGIVRLNNDGSRDFSFLSGTGAYMGNLVNPHIAKVYRQTDEKLVVVGKFEYVNGNLRNCIARLNADGSIDPTFDPGVGIKWNSSAASSQLTDMTILPNGQIVICGYFDEVNSSNYYCLAKLNSNGTLDQSFHTSRANDPYYTRVVQQGNHILVGGQFDIVYNDYWAPTITDTNARISRFDFNGNLDNSYSSCLPSLLGSPLTHIYVMEILVVSDSVHYVGEGVLTPGFASPRLAKMDVDGDSLGIGQSNNGGIYNIAFHPSGELLIASNAALSWSMGPLGFYNAQSPFYYMDEPTMSINVEHFGGGARDHILNTTTAERCSDLVVLHDNSIIAIGTFDKYNNLSSRGIVKLLPNGYIDNSFDVGTGFDMDNSYDDGPLSIVHLSNGNSIIGGDFVEYNGVPYNSLVCLDQHGAPISNFFADLSYSFFRPVSILVQDDQKILISGNGSVASVSSGQTRSDIFRLNANGTLDTTFNAANAVINGRVNTIDIQSSGKIMVGGYFHSFDGVVCRSLVRLNTNGSVDTTFSTGYGITSNGFSYAEIDKVLVLPNDNIVIGGDFGFVDTIASNNIAMLKNNGEYDTSFHIGTGFDYTIADFLYQPDGKLIVGGYFNSYNGTPADGMTRLMQNGEIDSTWSNTNYNTYAMDFQNGNVIAGGIVLSNTDWSAHKGIVRLGNSVDSAWLNIAFNPITGLNCTSPGTTEIIAISGTPPYTYQWTSPINTLDSLLDFSNPGVYTAQVTDSLNFSVQGAIYHPGPTSGTSHDLMANIVTTQFRPGFDVPIFVDAFNKTCIPASGNIQLILDSNLIYNGASPSPDNTSGDTLFWNFTNLIYDSIHTSSLIDVTVPAFMQIGDSIIIDLIIQPILNDLDTTNNRRRYKFPIVNGYDPNDKKVYPIGDCTPHYVDTNETLTYTVRFQNTGNSDAINIFVLDTLDPSLDLSSMHVVGRSHAMHTEILNNEILKFVFDDIHLPDSSVSQPASQGFVIFEINPLPGLANGTEIHNGSSIFFDYNPPIITNEVFNTISDGSHAASSVNIQLTECDSIDWNGVIYTTTGQYNHVYQNVYGCDSTVSLNLQVIQSSQSQITITKCDSLNLNGDTFINSGIYSQLLTNSAGCDSTITIDLTINSVIANAVLQDDTTIIAMTNNALYQWLDCSDFSMIPMANNQEFIAINNGSYAVEVQANGCSDTSDCITISTIGINEILFNKIEIYPNPSRGDITIDLKSDFAKVSIKVWSISGHLMKEVNSTNERFVELKMNSESGVYYLEIEVDNEITWAKILIQ